MEGCRVWNLGLLRVQGLGFEGLEFRVLGFRAFEGLGFRLEGSPVRALERLSLRVFGALRLHVLQVDGLRRVVKTRFATKNGLLDLQYSFFVKAYC